MTAYRSSDLWSGPLTSEVNTMMARAHFSIGGAVLGGLLLVATASAATLRVPAQFPSLRAALSAAKNGDEIIVADGVYAGRDSRNLDFAGRRIVLRSENGPQNCIIDCEGRNRAFRFHRGETAQSVLEGFTIQNGRIENDNGGAILCTGSSPTIRNCIFRSNEFFGPDSRRQRGCALANTQR